MKEVIFIFSFTVPAEKEDAYQKMLAETLDITKGEEGTLLYEVFKDENGVYCQHERYADEAACLTHVQNTGAQLQQWFELTDVKQTIALGDLSDGFKEKFQLQAHYRRFKHVER